MTAEQQAEAALLVERFVNEQLAVMLPTLAREWYITVTPRTDIEERPADEGSA